jgi:tetratricopeptide (TPR) repeat protein
MNRRIPFLAGALVALVGCVLAYRLPIVQEHLGWRVDELRARIKYALSPPEELVFVPDPTLSAMVQATLTSMAPTPTDPGPTAEPTAAPTSTPVPTPLPDRVVIEGIKYEDQHNRWNYCGPANFSMALTFWGWNGNRDVIGRVIKPSDKDKNVMPYEFQDYVADNLPGMNSVMRHGGDIQLLQRLLAAGFPVLTEKGYYERDYTGKLGWLGHYQFVTGYNEAEGVLIVQDTYLDGPDFHIPYADFINGWRSFNYVFMVAYPVDRQPALFEALGPWADEQWASEHALEVALAEGDQLSGIDQFFAWFNAGSSHVELQQYIDAAFAYDYAFALYGGLDADDSTRPYRIMWYQTGPYWAYYYAGRYTDVVTLATQTLDNMAEPSLEESYYWRALAREATGDPGGAVNDYQTSLVYHPGFIPTLAQLERLGSAP